MPGSGPRLLFFSGGSALRATARELIRHSFNTIHIMTPFDSGGSSASLRRAFAMPAVGDVRARVMDLADAHRLGNSEIYDLFAYRLPAQERGAGPAKELGQFARDDHPLIRRVPRPMRGVILKYLDWFAGHMPSGFPLAGASVGNLVLSAAYMTRQRRLAPVISQFSRMVRARGLVAPVVEDSAHLAVRLASGKIIVGQHRFTGKEMPPIQEAITSIWLTRTEDSPEPANIGINPEIAGLIRTTPCLCYPIGSFFSSLTANLLPKGVGKAVAANPGLKIFLPNPGQDPELKGQSLQSQIEHLLRPLMADAPGVAPSRLLSHLLIDPDNPAYPGGIPYERLRQLGIAVVRAPFLSRDGETSADPRLLASILLELARQGEAKAHTLWKR